MLEDGNMMAATPTAIDTAQLLPSAVSEANWYAAYTYGNHEKKAAAEIARRGIESFLPVYRTVRRWSDRRIELDMPLFPGYVFVRLVLHDRLRVLQVPGVARLVGFGGSPVALPDEQINGLRSGLEHSPRVRPHPFLTVGRRVKINHGPFAGSEGILVRKKGAYRLIVSLELIMRSVAIELEATDVEPLRLAESK